MVYLPTHTWWLLSGFACLALGLVIPEPGLPAMGLAAMITAIAALSIPSPPLQMLLWGGLSIVLSLLMKAMVPKESKQLSKSTEARVVTTIPPGGLGQVLYEGSLWKAHCHVTDMAIAPEQTVYVVGRRGTTLVVVPETSALEAHIIDPSD